MFSDKVLESLGKDGRSMPQIISITFDLGVTIVFAWNGAMVTAAFYLIHILLIESAWQKIKEIRLKKNENF